MSLTNKILKFSKTSFLLTLLLNTSALMSMTDENVETNVRVNATVTPSLLEAKIEKSFKTLGLGIALGTLETGSQISDGFQKIANIFSSSTKGDNKFETLKQGFIQIGKAPIRGYNMGLEAKGAIEISEQNPVINSNNLTATSPLNINMPKKNDRIIIVGAGPAGVHMAYILKQEKGYTNVQILEKSDRVGGKSFTITRGGISQELGTCYTAPQKYGELRRVMKNEPSFEEVGIFERSFYPSLDSTSPLTSDEWVLSVIQSRLPYNILPSVVAKAKLLTDLIKYNNLYMSIFGDYRPSVPFQPTPQNAKKIDKTFKEFLEENDLTSLIPMLSLSNTFQAYGYLEQVPAFYGLWWNSPALMNGAIANGINTTKPTSSLLRNGFQTVSEKLVQKGNLEVLLNYNIESIDRQNCQEGIKIKGSENGNEKNLNADFLILTANLKDSLNYLDSTNIEKEIFNNLNPCNFTATLFSCDSEQNDSAIKDYTSSLDPNSQGTITCQRRNAGILAPNQNAQTSNGKEYRVGFQYFSNATELTNSYKQELLKKLRKDLTTAGVTGLSIEEDQQHIWPYFSRFNQESINKGYPWKILEMQGKNNTWYAGASACFESLHDVYEYNRLLVSQLPD